MTQISDLPDLCVRKIVNYLGIIDIIRIDGMFPEWTSLQRNIDDIKKRKRLTLQLGDRDPMHFINKSSIKLPMKDQLADEGEQNESKSIKIKLNVNQMADGQLEQLNLHRFLPFLEWLEVLIDGLEVSNYKRLIPLLESFGDRLSTFHFLCNLWNDDDDDDEDVDSTGDGGRSSEPTFQSLLECINTRMTKLRCLHLDIRDEIIGDQNVDLPILGQLCEFRCSTNDDLSTVCEWLRRYATDRLRTIVIGNYGNSQDMFTQFGSMRLAKSFRLLSHISMARDFESRFRYFSAFDSLQSVQLGVENLTFSQLTACLLPLRDLKHLELWIDQDVSQFDSIPDEQIHSLPVRALSIKCFIEYLVTHREIRSRHWPRMFPACCVLKFCDLARSCEHCAWEKDSETNDDANRINHCRKCRLATFKALPNLREIYYDSPIYHTTFQLSPNHL